jgi:hypothetical protein
MYSGYLLSKNSRNHLMELFPPKYSTILGHHITYKFGIKNNDDKPDVPQTVKVIGYIDNGDSVEGLLVEIDGSVYRPDGSKFHITWSIDKDKGAKPVDTNRYVNDAKMITPIDISVEPKIFFNSTESYLK